MNDPVGAWIVTSIIIAGATAIVLLVKRWTGTTVREILFEWDPRQTRPKRPNLIPPSGTETHEPGTTPPTLTLQLGRNPKQQRSFESYWHTATQEFGRGNETGVRVAKVLTHFERDVPDLTEGTQTENIKEIHIVGGASNRYNTRRPKKLPQNRGTPRGDRQHAFRSS